MSSWFETYGFADVHDGLAVGALPADAADVRAVADVGVTRVINLVEDHEYPRGARAEVTRALAAAGIQEARFSTEDYGGLTPDLLDGAAGQIAAWVTDGQMVYVHCRAGWQRSATVATAAVTLLDHVDPDTALRRVQQRKPTATPLPQQLDDLRHWYDSRTPSRQAPADFADPRF